MKRDALKYKFPGTLTVDEAFNNLKNNLCMGETPNKPKTKIQELHDINGTIYTLIEHLHSLDVPLGLVYQKLRETTTEIQGAITKLLNDEVQESYNAVSKSNELENDIKGTAAFTENKKVDIIVEYETKKR